MVAELLSPGTVAAFGIAGAVTAVAGLMRGFVGVGSGMLMAPVFAIVFGPVDTVTMIVVMEIFVTAQLMPSVHRLVEWRVVLPMGAAAVAFMPAGTWILLTVDGDAMTRAIAALVLVSVLVLMSGWRYRGEKRLDATLGVGAVSGILMAATSLGNPPVMVYLLSGRDSAATNRANFTGYFCVTLLALLAIMAARGLIRADAVLRAVLLMPVFAAAAWLGARWFRSAGEAWYRRLAYSLLLAVSVFGILR
jgi:hypothetical protein